MTHITWRNIHANTGVCKYTELEVRAAALISCVYACMCVPLFLYSKSILFHHDNTHMHAQCYHLNYKRTISCTFPFVLKKTIRATGKKIDLVTCFKVFFWRTNVEPNNVKYKFEPDKKWRFSSHFEIFTILRAFLLLSREK